MHLEGPDDIDYTQNSLSSAEIHWSGSEHRTFKTGLVISEERFSGMYGCADNKCLNAGVAAGAVGRDH